MNGRAADSAQESETNMITTTTTTNTTATKNLDGKGAVARARRAAKAQGALERKATKAQGEGTKRVRPSRSKAAKAARAAAPTGFAPKDEAHGGEKTMGAAVVHSAKAKAKISADVLNAAVAKASKALNAQVATEAKGLATPRMVANRIAHQTSTFRVELAACLGVTLKPNATARVNAKILAAAALVAAAKAGADANLVDLCAAKEPKTGTKAAKASGPSKVSIVIDTLRKGATLEALVKACDPDAIAPKATELTVRTIVSDIRSEKWGGAAIKAIREAGFTVEKNGETYKLARR